MSTLRPLTIPETLDPVHAGLLRELHFETVGDAGDRVAIYAYRNLRVIYAITNPARTELVYIGDSEIGRDLQGRLKDHLSRREKAEHVEKNSLVFAHVLITEYRALDRFQELTGRLPLLNHRKTRRHNDLEAMAAYMGRTVEEMRDEIEAEVRRTQAARDAEEGPESFVRLANARPRPFPLRAAKRRAPEKLPAEPVRKTKKTTVRLLGWGPGYDDPPPPPKRKR